MRAFFVVPALLLSFTPAFAQDAAPAPGEPSAAAAPEPDDDAAALPDPARSRGAGREKSAGTPLKPVEAPDARTKRLDALFAELAREASTPRAERLAARINAEWADSGSATVDLLLRRGREAMARNDNGAALDFLDQAIVLDPNFAEGWNARATLNFINDDYSKSLDDIRATLALEPRHFGALSGLAAILEQTGRKQAALDVYLRILTIYPAMKSAQEAVGRLTDDLTGRAL